MVPERFPEIRIEVLQMTTSNTGARAAEFESLRPRLLGIAYRMLQTRQEAEDVVQEAWLRLERAGPIDSLEGFLVTAVTRLCLDVLKSARVRREEYIGPWLPEPLRLDEAPDRAVDRTESVSLALLHLIDRLEPVERAVFLLHEVFEYPYRDVARIVQKSEDNCRQIAVRARRAVKGEGEGAGGSIAEHGELLGAFLEAARQGDLDRLESLLTEDCVLLSDSGGKVAAARNPIRGQNAIARFMAGVSNKAPEAAVLSFENLNGLPAAVVSVHGQPILAMALQLQGGKVRRVFAIRNPDKLAGTTPTSETIRLH